MVISNRVAFWDGDNFVIVNKNCTQEQAVKLLQALAVADIGEAGETEETEMAADSYAQPVEEPMEEMPTIPDNAFEYIPDPGPFVFPKGKYEGMTPEEVLEQDKGKGFANLTYLTSRYPEAKGEIRDAQLRFFARKFEKMKTDTYQIMGRADEEWCRKFFMYYTGILTDIDRDSLMQQTGSADFDAMLKDASIEQRRSMIACIIEKYTA